MKDITTLEVIEVEDLAAEAWQHFNEGKSLPKFHLKKVKAWAKGKASRDPPDNASARSGRDGADSENEEDDDELFGDAGPTSRDLATLAEDKKRHGLSGVRILVLATACELGRVPALGTSPQRQASRFCSRPAQAPTATSTMSKAWRTSSLRNY